MFEFFKELIKYVSAFNWWEGLIILTTIMIVFFVGKYWRNIITLIGKNLFKDKPENKTIYYRMFWGLTNDAINIVIHSEIRRSLKENGFYNLEFNDFLQYVKNQSENIFSLLKNQILNLYPSTIKGVSLEKIIDELDIRKQDIDKMILEIYTECQKIYVENQELLQKFDKEFGDDIDKFVSNKDDNIKCSDCLLILFSKRELNENKKNQIKILKLQMNYVERRLIELHSSLITFYSEQLNNLK